MLRIAVPNKGTLSEAAVEMLREAGYAALTVQGERGGTDVMALLDTGARTGTSSAGGHGISPLPARTVRMEARP